MRIDAHHHFWQVARGDYGWLASHPSINRDYMPADFLPLIKAANIEKTILVQAAPKPAETKFLLETARATDFVGGVVGWIDFEVADAAEQIGELGKDPLLVGLRPMIQDITDDTWMLKPELAPAFDAMIAHHLRFDALVKPRHLKSLLKFLQRWPDLPVVIDHGAKPDIAGNTIEPWATDMRRIAKESNAFCKISGLVTEARADSRTTHLRPFVDVILDAFGAERSMWGSDWPVVNEAGGFARWHETARELTSHLPLDAQNALFGRTAMAFYGLSP